MKRFGILSVLLSTILTFGLTLSVSADELEVVISTHFDAPTIERGYTLESHDGVMRLGIRPGTLNSETTIDVKTLDAEVMVDTLPADKVLLSDIYLFDILDPGSYDGKDFFFLEIGYESETQEMKKIYFYNKPANEWQILPSTDHPDIDKVRALIHLPYARLAVFGDSSVMEYGQASWYSYKDCNCAASPDYPKGTFLLVTSVDEPEKSVVVEVNDYGPERDIFPERVIDLDVLAYEQLAPKWTGVIDVRVQLLQTAD